MVDNVMHAISTVWYNINHAPRGLFPGFGPTSKAREQCPGDKGLLAIYLQTDATTPNNVVYVCTGLKG